MHSNRLIGELKSLEKNFLAQGTLNSMMLMLDLYERHIHSTVFFSQRAKFSAYQRFAMIIELYDVILATSKTLDKDSVLLMSEYFQNGAALFLKTKSLVVDSRDTLDISTVLLLLQYCEKGINQYKENLENKGAVECLKALSEYWRSYGVISLALKGLKEERAELYSSSESSDSEDEKMSQPQKLMVCDPLVRTLTYIQTASSREKNEFRAKKVLKRFLPGQFVKVDSDVLKAFAAELSKEQEPLFEAGRELPCRF